MKKQQMMAWIGAAGVAMGAAQAAEASVFITEWLYSGGSGEFVEFTNTGNSAVDMTGWVYDDDSRLSSPSSATGGSTAGLDLTPFGVVAAGESVIITESSAAAFRTAWGLSASVKVIGLYENNLGRADEINLFDGTGALVDRLAYGDQVFVGSPRTQDFSGNPGAGALGANDPTLWVSSFVGDEFGSFASSNGEVGNPGSFVPEPGSLALLGLGGLALLRRRRSH